MNKENLIYVYVGVISLLLIGIVLTLFIIKHTSQISKTDELETLADSLAVQTTIPIEEIEVSLPEDPVEPEKRSFLGEYTFEPVLTEYERSVLELTQRLQVLFGLAPAPQEEEEEELEPFIDPVEVMKAEMDSILTVMSAQMDSTLTVMNAQIDSLNYVLRNMSMDNTTHRSMLEARERQNTELRNQVVSLNNIITSLKNDIYRLNNPEVVETPPPNYAQLARIYNNMDAKKVAVLLQELSTEDAVEVLKLMNPRKMSQIMAALPTNVATKYSQLLMQN